MLQCFPESAASILVHTDSSALNERKLRYKARTCERSDINSEPLPFGIVITPVIGLKHAYHQESLDTRFEKKRNVSATKAYRSVFQGSCEPYGHGSNRYSVFLKFAFSSGCLFSAHATNMLSKSNRTSMIAIYRF